MPVVVPVVLPAATLAARQREERQAENCKEERQAVLGERTD